MIEEDNIWNDSINSLIKEFENDKSIIAFSRTGSSYICSPPVKTTDIDFIILCSEYILNIIIQVYGPLPYGNSPEIVSIKDGKYNFLFTDDKFFYKKHVAATEEAKRKNILDKKDRVNFFRKILYGA